MSHQDFFPLAVTGVLTGTVNLGEPSVSHILGSAHVPETLMQNFCCFGVRAAEKFARS